MRQLVSDTSSPSGFSRRHLQSSTSQDKVTSATGMRRHGLRVGAQGAHAPSWLKITGLTPDETPAAPCQYQPPVSGTGGASRACWAVRANRQQGKPIAPCLKKSVSRSRSCAPVQADFSRHVAWDLQTPWLQLRLRQGRSLLTTPGQASNRCATTQAAHCRPNRALASPPELLSATQIADSRHALLSLQASFPLKILKCPAAGG